MSGSGKKKTDNRSYSWATEQFSSDDDDDDDGRSAPDTLTPCYEVVQVDGEAKCVEIPHYSLANKKVSKGSPTNMTPSSSPEEKEEEDEIENQGHEEENAGVCKPFYEKEGNCKARLIAMSWGLTDSGRQLGNIEEEPYKSCSNKKKVLPTNNIIKEEILRRAEQMKFAKGKAPKCTHWARPKCKEWLIKNPVSNPVDVAFIIAEEGAFYKVLKKARAESTTVSKICTNWVTNEPWLRLALCATHDQAKIALLRRDEVMAADELDAKKGDGVPETYEEVVARLFNDENRIFYTQALPNLHASFSNPIELTFENMPGPITPEEVKTRLADTRAKLIKVINKWELSGNGFGQRHQTEDGGFERGYGHLLEEHYHAGDNRASFLGPYREYVLYFWELFDSGNVLDTILAVLSDDVAVDTECDDLTECSGNESTRKKKRKQEQQEEECRQFRAKFGAAMAHMSYSALLENLRVTQASIADHKLKELLADNEAVKAVHRDLIKQLESTVETISERMESMTRDD